MQQASKRRNERVQSNGGSVAGVVFVIGADSLVGRHPGAERLEQQLMQSATAVLHARGQIMSKATESPVVEYHADYRFSLRASLRELWAFREVTWAFGMRRLRTRYKQAIFGLGWAVIQPIAFLAVFVVFLERTNAVSGGDNYAAGTYGALVAWQYVSSATASAGASLVTDSSLLRRIYFPREAPVLGSVLAFLPDLAINLVLLLVMAPILGGDLGFTWLLLPIPSVLLIVSSLAVGMPLAAMAVYYRDFLYALPIGIQLWLFASPIAFSADAVSDTWRPVYAAVNPLVGPLEAFRDISSDNRMPDWSLLGISAVSGFVLLLIGYRILKALDRRMADVV